MPTTPYNGSPLGTWFADPRRDPNRDRFGNVVITPTATAPVSATPGMTDVIQGLLTPGLVPDIARQSAEVSAGRGVAGSPAGASTAVKMSEQNYLQRLGLANTLLSGESSRTQPYQITPYQAQSLQNQRDIAQAHYGGRGVLYPGASGGGSVPRGTSSPWAGFIGQQPAIGAVGGTRPSDTGYGGGMPLYPGGPTVGGGNPTLSDMEDWFNWDAPGNSGSGAAGDEGFDPLLGVPWDEGFGDIGG